MQAQGIQEQVAQDEVNRTAVFVSYYEYFLIPVLFYEFFQRTPLNVLSPLFVWGLKVATYLKALQVRLHYQNYLFIFLSNNFLEGANFAKPCIKYKKKLWDFCIKL